MKSLNTASVASVVLLTLSFSCSPSPTRPHHPDPGDMRSQVESIVAPAEPSFRHEAERFGDLRVLRYQVPGFAELDLQKKKLLYYLYEAALAGREIIYDQKYGYNLTIKRTLEEIVRRYPGDRTTDDFGKLLVYVKRVWFSNGIHHHYSNEKFVPEISFDVFAGYVRGTPGSFPVREGQSPDDLLAELRPVMFDPEVDAKLVNKAKGEDLVATSAVNFYVGVNQKDVEAFYAARRKANDPTPISYGLNAQLVGTVGHVAERVWKVGGMYGEALTEVVSWLEQAVGVAENDAQRDALRKLVKYYRSGDLVDWDVYNIAWSGANRWLLAGNIAWVKDIDSDIDVISGFVEVYNDPLGYRGSFESVVSVRDPVATKRIAALAEDAQWFEDHAPLVSSHRKKEVKGISAKVINVVVESGDSSPASPIGINLPNADWIRKQHGSKSVNLANIVTAYNQVKGAALSEFAWDEDEIARSREHGELADNLHTDMHEVLGHASGQINPGVGTPKQTLKNYASTLEEARADLFALYYMLDEKLVDMGLMSSLEVGRAGYDMYIRNGLISQLRRVKPGADIEEDHMRNRQLVAAWVYEKGKVDNVIEKRTRDGKTFFVVRDYQRLRVLFGDLLREIQRIKSEGDFEGGEHLVETYGVKVDPDLHREVLARYEKLDVPAFSGFINPVLTPVEKDGEIVDVRISYPDDFTKQMLDYAERYAFLPAWN